MQEELSERRRRPKRPSKLPDQELEGGGRILWSTRATDADRTVRVDIFCPTCKRTRRVPVQYRIWRERPPKLCGECDRARRARVEDKRHPSGAVVHWGDRDMTRLRLGRASSAHVGFTCAHCGGHDYTTRTNVDRENWEGLCSKCKPFMKTGDERHSSGAVVHWSERKPGNSQRVAFTCRTWSHKITRAIIADGYATEDGKIPEDSTVGKWVREFYGSGVSVPVAVSRILNGTRINTDFDRENNSPI